MAGMRVQDGQGFTEPGTQPDPFAGLSGGETSFGDRFAQWFVRKYGRECFQDLMRTVNMGTTVPFHADAIAYMKEHPGEVTYEEAMELARTGRAATVARPLDPHKGPPHHEAAMTYMREHPGVMYDQAVALVAADGKYGSAQPAPVQSSPLQPSEDAVRQLTAEIQRRFPNMTAGEAEVFARNQLISEAIAKIHAKNPSEFTKSMMTLNAGSVPLGSTTLKFS